MAQTDGAVESLFALGEVLALPLLRTTLLLLFLKLKKLHSVVSFLSPEMFWVYYTHYY